MSPSRISLAVLITALAFGTLALPSPATAADTANDAHVRAMALAETKDFAGALQLLASEDAAHQAGFDHRFLQSRLLAWDGQHGQAQAQLDALIAEHPGNPDLALMRGNVAFYQGRLNEAEAYFSSILTRFPDYFDAQTALDNVRRVQTARRDNRRGDGWRVDAGGGLSSLSDGLDDWRNQYIRAQRALGDVNAFGSVQRFSRFGMTDTSMGLGASDNVRGGLDWSVQAEVTPDADFRPEWSAGGTVGHAVETGGTVALYPSLSYRYDQYANQTIHNLSPELTASLENGVELTGRLIGTLPSEEDNQLGWLVSGSVPVTDAISARLGYANAPEAINGVTTTTTSVFGGISYSVTDDVNVRLDVGHDDRENSYSRTHANVAVTYQR